MLVENTIITQIICIIATVTTAISLLPQLLKIYRSRSAKDISHLSMFYMAICSLSWILYGLIIDDFIVWSPNVICLLSCVGIIYGKIRLG
jgi:MtN3 and saliva related transmembrane protein